TRRRFARRSNAAATSSWPTPGSAWLRKDSTVGSPPGGRPGELCSSRPSPISLSPSRVHDLRGNELPDSRAAAQSATLVFMSTVAFDVPEESLIALKLDASAAAAELRLAAAVKLYELGRLSSGAAASLAGLPRVA